MIGQRIYAHFYATDSTYFEGLPQGINLNGTFHFLQNEKHLH